MIAKRKGKHRDKTSEDAGNDVREQSLSKFQKAHVTLRVQEMDRIITVILLLVMQLLRISRLSR